MRARKLAGKLARKRFGHRPSGPAFLAIAGAALIGAFSAGSPALAQPAEEWTDERREGEETEREESRQPVFLDLVSTIEFSREGGTIAWDGAPLAGREMTALIGLPAGIVGQSARAIVSPLSLPGGDGTRFVLLTEVAPRERAPGYATLRFTLPEGMPPGAFRLSLRNAETVFGTLDLEVADPALIVRRSVAFARARAALDGMEGAERAVWSADYRPVPAGAGLVDAQSGEDLFRTPADAGQAPTWLFAADIDGARYLVFANEEQSAKPVLFGKDGGTGEAGGTDETAEGEGGREGAPRLTGWGAYVAVPAPPAMGDSHGGYNGWFWHPDGAVRRFPHDGICREGGEGSCSRPRPVGGDEADNPLDMPEGGAQPVGPGQPEEGGENAGNGEGRGNGAGREGTREREPEPEKPSFDPVKTTFTPEEVFTPTILKTACKTDFSEHSTSSTGGRNFQYPPFFRNKVKHRTVESPAIVKRVLYENLPVYRGTVYFAVARTTPRTYYEVRPGMFMGPFDDFPWTPQRVRDAIDRAIKWYGNYCVFLTFERVDTPALALDAPVIRSYRNWLKGLTAKVGNTIKPESYGDRGVRELRAIETAMRGALAGKTGAVSGSSPLALIFMDRLVDANTRDGSTERLTEASLAISQRNALAMHGNDADDPYVLVHELIHALGRKPVAKPAVGPYSWDHSVNDNAMSHLVRRSSKTQSGLTAKCLWDFAEYQDATTNGQLKPVVVPAQGTISNLTGQAVDLSAC